MRRQYQQVTQKLFHTPMTDSQDGSQREKLIHKTPKPTKQNLVKNSLTEAVKKVSTLKPSEHWSEKRKRTLEDGGKSSRARRFESIPWKWLWCQRQRAALMWSSSAALAFLAELQKQSSIHKDLKTPSNPEQKEQCRRSKPAWCWLTRRHVYRWNQTEDLRYIPRAITTGFLVRC